jgi:thymidylate kinase
LLIALEGLDGAGKTTIAQLLATQLDARYMRLPPAEMGQAAGEFLARPSAVSRYLYYLAGAARIDETHRASAGSVIADRYITSVHALHLTAPDWAASTLRPWPVRPADVTVYLHVDEAERRQRLAARGRPLDHFERLLEDQGFRRRVEAVLTTAPRLTRVDTTQRSPHEVTLAALAVIRRTAQGAASMESQNPTSLLETLRLAQGQAQAPTEPGCARLGLRLHDLLTLVDLGLLQAAIERDARGSICRVAVKSLTPRGHAILADPAALERLLRAPNQNAVSGGVHLSDGSSYVIVHGDITQGVIASGRQAQAAVSFGSSTTKEAELRQLIDQLDTMLPDLPLVSEERERASAEIAALRTQLASPAPRPSLVRASLAGLNAVLAGVAGNAAFTGLAQLLRNMHF